MKREKLTMLPSQRFENLSEMPVIERDGFVDEAVVQALLAGPVIPRHAPNPSELVLSVDDMDFAGWQLSSRLPATATVAQTPPYMEAIKRPAPPEIEEPGLGEPHRGSHRWWLAGLAGALSTMLFSVLLLSLSSREQAEPEGISVIQVPAKARTNPSPATKPTPELTGLEVVK